MSYARHAVRLKPFEPEYAVALEIPPVRRRQAPHPSPVVTGGEQGVQQALAAELELVHPVKEQHAHLRIDQHGQTFLRVPPLLAQFQRFRHLERVLETALVGDDVTELGENLCGNCHSSCAAENLLLEQLPAGAVGRVFTYRETDQEARVDPDHG